MTTITTAEIGKAFDIIYEGLKIGDRTEKNIAQSVIKSLLNS